MQRLRPHPASTALPTWQPKSGFFQAVMKRIRRPEVVQQAPREHNAKLAFCTFHNTAYLSGDELPNSPCCDTPPLLTYDLEELTDAAAIVYTFVALLGVADADELKASLVVLAELARAGVAGETGELSQEPSSAAGAPATASVQDGPRLPPVTSEEGSTQPPPAGTPPEVTDAATDAGPQTPAPAPSRPAKKIRAKRPAAVAS